MGILDGKAVVITGAGRGIGKGHAEVLASEGASVVINDVDLEVAQEAVDEITKAGGSAVANGSDIGTRAGCEELVEQCISAYGKLDASIANAGIVRDRSLLKMTDEEFDDVFRIHAKSTFWVGQLAARHLKERGAAGCIINTTSGAHFGNFGQTNYGGAKGMIASMTYTWALELARYGIRVNAIAPAATTRMTDVARNPDGTKVELPFWDPALNSPIVAYMISDEGNWITGQILATGMERLGIMIQPRYGPTLMREGGWDVESVRRWFKDALGKQLEPFGLGKAPYPYYDGLEPKL